MPRNIFDEQHGISLSDPARDFLPVVPNDGADLPETAVALYIETGGTLKVTTAAGMVREVKTPDFFVFPVGVTRVHATDTTASGIHAFLARGA